MQSEKSLFNGQDIDRIIQMAWEDRTPFEAIEFQFGLKEKAKRGVPVKYMDTVDGGKVPVATIYDIMMGHYGGGGEWYPYPDWQFWRDTERFFGFEARRLGGQGGDRSR